MFSRLILPFFLLFAAVASLQAAQLQKIEHKKLAAGSEEVVLSFDTVAEPRVFTMGGKQPRVVFDFAGVEPRSTLRDVAPQAAVVQDIRLGIHRQGEVKTRLVLDVHSLQGLKHSYSVDEKNNRVVVRFTSADVGAEAALVAKQKPAQTAPAKLQAASTKKKGTGQDRAAVAEKEQKAEKAAQPDAAKEAELAQGEKTPATTPAAAKEPAAEARRASPQAEQTLAAAKPAEKTGSPVPAPPAEQQQAATPPAASGAAVAPVAGESTSATPAASAPAAPSEVPYLSAIQYDPDSPRGELVQFKLNGFYPPVLRSIESGSPQVICEFSNLQVAPALEGPIKISGRLVKAIRLDKSSDGSKVRVFVELEPNQSYDLQQVFFKEDNFFVLIVNTVKA